MSETANQWRETYPTEEVDQFLQRVQAVMSGALAAVELLESEWDKMKAAALESGVPDVVRKGARRMMTEVGEVGNCASRARAWAGEVGTRIARSDIGPEGTVTVF